MKSSSTRFRLAAAFALLAAVMAGAFTPATAQQASRALPPNVGTGDCDRACLEGLANRYVEALIAHNPAMLPLAKNVLYSENGVELPIPDAFWTNATGARPYRLFVADPEWGTIGFIARMFENGAPVIVTTRLRVYNRQITEIETIVAQEGGSRNPGAVVPDVLGDTPRPEFLRTVPVGQRRSRDDLMKIANTYFTGIENNTGKRVPIFSDKCHRLENGRATSNVPPQPGAEPRSSNYTCRQGIALGYHRNDNRLRNRRILAVDLERQIVIAGVYFDHQNSAYIRSYQTNDGRTVKINDTMPTTLGMHEIFSIDEQGISQVEAVMTSVPYGMRPYFSTGFKMDSEQTIKDGFREY